MVGFVNGMVAPYILMVRKFNRVFRRLLTMNCSTPHAQSSGYQKPIEAINRGKGQGIAPCFHTVDPKANAVIVRMSVEEPARLILHSGIGV
jgi:hypothetical protein